VLSGTGASATCTSTFTVTEVTTHTVSAEYIETALQFESSGTAAVSVGYVFSGFFSPINNGVLNNATANQAIPVKWRLADANGVGISDPDSFKGVWTSSTSCGSTATTADVTEDAAGKSGLQYLGDGNWQYNWKTPKTYAKTCRTMSLILADQITLYGMDVDADRQVNFKFR
jgi:hypothetical protein